MSPKINLRVQHVTLSNSLIMSCSSSTVGFSPTDLWGFRQNSHKVNQNDDNDGFHDVISSHTRITMISLSEFPTWEETRAAWWRASPSCPPTRWTSPWTGSPKVTCLMIVVVMVMMVMMTMMTMMVMMVMMMVVVTNLWRALQPGRWQPESTQVLASTD